ncbi:MAG: tyrosine-protein phosphatase [Gemmataceae bacterium]|nr:tyrosine-protein phosphatase [Gemmataceae bacterium]
MNMVVRWILGLSIAALLIVAPFVYFRAEYTHGKRLREVSPGVLYRCGQLTQQGFAEAVAAYGIRTIVNVQDEYPDPDIARSYFDRRTIKETALCRQLGVYYVHMSPDLIPRRTVPAERPAAIDRFLALMDDPANHPVLLHCKAGLHRTGVLSAVYRMEYDHWTPRQAIEELKQIGFGEFACTAANDYIVQYVLSYRPGQRRTLSVGE